MSEEAQILKCPACGASLESAIAGEIVYCKFCGSVLRVPEPSSGQSGGSGHVLEAVLIKVLKDRLAKSAAVGQRSPEEQARRQELAQKFLAKAEKERQLAAEEQRKADELWREAEAEEKEEDQ